MTSPAAFPPVPAQEAAETRLAERFATALPRVWAHLASSIPGGWSRREGAALAVVTGAHLASLNGVWCERTDVPPEVLGSLLMEVRSRGLPCCVQLRAGVPAATLATLRTQGLAPNHDRPAMVLDDTSRLAAHLDAPDLTLRTFAPTEVGLHLGLLVAGFEVPASRFEPLISPRMVALPGVRAYVGEVASEPVVTGLSVRLGEALGIFNIATASAHRRRGYGAAVTARAVADGFAAGATFAFLQSSPMGHPVYEALGFRTVETWQVWV
jgi:ribosomal protein S18 acetylase RimI-like enzyme